MLRRGLAPRFFWFVTIRTRAADRARLKRSDVRHRGCLRVPGAASLANPRLRSQRHPLRQPRTLAPRRALPAAFDALCRRVTRAHRIITGASKRGEPLREGRLWRSRRKSGSRGEESLGRRRSRAGYPLADVICATRSPERSGTSRFDTKAKRSNYLPRSRTTTAPLPPACRGASQ
jgi:hypothetical protein